MSGAEPCTVAIDPRGVARLTLNADAAGRVSLGPERVRALAAAVEELAQEGPRALVLASSSAEFCRGLDLAAVTADTARTAEIEDACRRFTAVLLRLRTIPAAVVALVDGPTIGGGVGLVAVADIVVATPRATFRLPELSLGLTPALVTEVARRRLRPATLLDWSLRGDPIDAATAHTAGLVDRLVQGDALSRVDTSVLKYILRCEPQALAALKAELSLGDRLDRRLTLAADRLVASLRDPALCRALAGLVAGEAPPWFGSLGGVR